MSKKLTREEFLKILNEKRGLEFELVGEYIDTQTPTQFKHMTCGRVFEKRPTKLITKINGGCSWCAKKFKKTTEYFKDEIKEKYGNEYEILGEYESARKPLSTKHVKCGNIWNITPDNLLRGKGCPICSNKKPHDEFVKDIDRIFDGSIVVLEEYQGVTVEIKFHCNIHNIDFYRDPQNMIGGHGCPMCNSSRRKTQEEFENEVAEMYGDEYIVIGQYINCKTRLKIKHNCGCEYDVIPSKFLAYEYRCPVCERNMSKYSGTVKNFLDYNNIEYVTEKRFKDCKHKQQLPFDFYLEKYNCCIEVDGEQHFKAINYFGGEENLEVTKFRDEIKNTYCKENNIKLIRLPYFDWNKFYDILAKELHINTEVTCEIKAS